MPASPDSRRKRLMIVFSAMMMNYVKINSITEEVILNLENELFKENNKDKK